ncbi:MAG: SDR family oxidoreductase [Myxococcales bacterium]|nr:SDR family oxidoreductase [Myxococcales bacterium]
MKTVYREDLFADRVAIVTGGATGIGLAIAEALLMLGCDVVIASRNRKRLLTSARGLSEDYGREVLPFTCNIRKRPEIDALMDATLGRFGKLDFVINNGGGQFMAPAAQIREKGWNAVIETNLSGTFQMCQAAHACFMRDHGGRIVNIVADMWRGFPSMVHTGAARAAVVNMTKTLAIEWAKDGVLINCVAPGTILSTGMHNYPPEVPEAAARVIPLKRLGTVEEIADSVLYFLSPAGSFTTGATLRVDGGGSLWGDGFQIPDRPDTGAGPIPPWPEQRWPQHVPDE